MDNIIEIVMIINGKEHVIKIQKQLIIGDVQFFAGISNSEWLGQTIRKIVRSALNK